MRGKERLLLACTHSFGAKFFEGQLQFMKDMGFDVVVISAPGKEIEQLCEVEGATFIPFLFRREISPITDLKAIIKLIRILTKINPTIINAGTPKAGLLICLAAKLSGFKPIIYTLRGLRSDTLGSFKGFVVKAMEKFTCRLADVVIPISPSLDLHAQKRGILQRKKSVVLGLGSSNGVNVSKFTPSFSVEERNKMRGDLGISENDFVVSYVGRINQDKGVAELFQTIKMLASHKPWVKLLIVGEFEVENPLPDHVKHELLLHSNVIFEGYREDIKSIYEVIDLLVLYSKREGFGNILIEASSMEIPVIASNIPGCRDAVQNGVSGYLVNNTSELFDRLNYYTENREIAKSNGIQGREWVKKNFESTVIWNQQLSLYNQLLNRK